MDLLAEQPSEASSQKPEVLRSPEHLDNLAVDPSPCQHPAKGFPKHVGRKQGEDLFFIAFILSARKRGSVGILSGKVLGWKD